MKNIAAIQKKILTRGEAKHFADAARITGKTIAFTNGCFDILHDMLGINTEFKPRFLRQYLNIYDQVIQAVKKYVHDVKKKDFPNDSEQY